jgi:hypothetical protein
MSLSPIEILAEADGLGLKLGFEPPNTLTVEPDDRCPPDFIETLTRHKPQLLVVLRTSTPKRLSEAVPLEQRLYVVQDRDGDYLREVIATDWETVPFEFRWTKHIHLAARYCDDELNSKTDAVSLMQRVIHGHSGARQIRVR